MMASVMCPACQHKQLLPEIEVGKLQNCPNCQSSFVAGTSKVESRGMLARASSSPPQPSYGKTMLTDEGQPPIKYNCPRCKAPLEAPSIEGGTKKNCIHCTQRHQVPTASAPVAAAPAPNLNKTMLAGDERLAPTPPTPPIKYNCPNCKKPLEAPASEGGTKKNCIHCFQRLQVPAAPSGLNKTKLASSDDNGEWPTSSNGARGASSPTAGGKEQAGPKPWTDAIPLTPRNLAIGVAVLLLLVFVVPAVISGGKRTDTEAASRAQMELEKLKADIAAKQNEMEQRKNAEADTRRQMDEMMKRMKDQEEKRSADFLELLRRQTDDKKRAEMEEKFNADRRKMEEDKRDMERKQQQMLEDAKRKLEESARALDASKQRQQTIIQQPPPVMYYPPYHHRYYWPW